MVLWLRYILLKTIAQPKFCEKFAQRVGAEGCCVFLDLALKTGIVKTFRTGRGQWGEVVFVKYIQEQLRNSDISRNTKNRNSNRFHKTNYREVLFNFPFLSIVKKFSFQMHNKRIDLLFLNL